MTKKLINIKNLLRIIISLFVIINMFKSCAKAYTFDEFIEFCGIVKDLENATTTQKNLANFIINHQQNYKNKFGSNIDCTSWVAGFSNNSQYGDQYQVCGWKGGTAVNLGYYGSNSFITNNTYYTKVFYTARGNAYYQDGSNFGTNGFILVDNTLNNGIDWGNRIANQYYITTHIYFGNMFSTTITYNGEEMQANELNYNYRIEYIDNVVTEDNEITSMQATLGSLNLECQDLGSYWTLKCNNSTQLQYNQVYDLNVSSIVNGNEEEIEEKVIFVPPGTTITGGVITNIPSGDYNFNTENATNQIIENQNQNNNEIIQSINNIVGNLPESFSGDSSGDLSSGFDGGGGILGGIFSLFVPNGQFFRSYFEDLNNWFSARLGILYFPIELTIDFLTRCLNIDFTQQVLSIGPYTMPLNDDFELVPEIQIDFNSFLEDETVASIHNIYLLITDGLIIFGLYRLIIKKYNNIVKNKGGG